MNSRPQTGLIGRYLQQHPVGRVCGEILTIVLFVLISGAVVAAFVYQAARVLRDESFDERIDFPPEGRVIEGDLEGLAAPKT